MRREAIGSRRADGRRQRRAALVRRGRQRPGRPAPARRARRLGALGAGRPLPRRAVPHDPHRPPLLRPLGRAGRAVVVAGRRVGVLDELGIERAALVGLSLGGKLALDIALAHPERLWAVVARRAGARRARRRARTPRSTRPATRRPRTRDSRRCWRSTSRSGLRSAPTSGSGELWHATPDANPLPDGVEPLEPPGAPAKERLGELAVPDARRHGRARPARASARSARSWRGAAPNARHVELDSDHYVTLREPELLSGVLLDFLAGGGAGGVAHRPRESARPPPIPAPGPGPRGSRRRAYEIAPAADGDRAATGAPLLQFTASVRPSLRRREDEVVERAWLVRPHGSSMQCATPARRCRGRG